MTGSVAQVGVVGGEQVVDVDEAGLLELVGEVRELGRGCTRK